MTTARDDEESEPIVWICGDFAPSGVVYGKMFTLKSPWNKNYNFVAFNMSVLAFKLASVLKTMTKFTQFCQVSQDK